MDFKFKKSNLNFRVYTSESEPTTPGNENDIVIITSVPMTNWILSPDKPEGMPRTDGDVWIRYSAEGNTFNVLKTNSMQIATISAHQYVDGTWVDVTAKSYQGGKWVGWIVHMRIYELGWADSENNLIQLASDYSGNTSTVDKWNIEVSYSSGYIVMTRTSYNGMACVYTKLEYDLTNVNTIYCKTGSIGNGYGSDNGAIYFGVGKVGSTVSSAKIKLTESNTEYALNVSDLSGKFVIGFYGPENSASNWIWNARQIEAFWY